MQTFIEDKFKDQNTLYEFLNDNISLIEENIRIPLEKKQFFYDFMNNRVDTSINNWRYSHITFDDFVDMMRWNNYEKYKFSQDYKTFVGEQDEYVDSNNNDVDFNWHHNIPSFPIDAKGTRKIIDESTYKTLKIYMLEKENEN